MKNKDDIRNFEINLPQKVLIEFLTAHQFRYLDLLVPFQKESSKKELFFINDSHWNRDGHALAADIIFKRNIDLWKKLP